MIEGAIVESRTTGQVGLEPRPRLPEEPSPPLPPLEDEPPNARKPPKHPDHDVPMEPPEIEEPPRIDPVGQRRS